MPSIWADTLDEHRRLVLDRLLDAFESLVAERGFEATTLAAVAAEAGIARSAIYNHVKDRHALLFAAVERSMDAVVGHLAREVEEADGPVEALEVYVAQTLTSFATHPIAGHDFSGMLTPEEHAALLGHLDPVRRILERIITDGVEAGVFTGDPRMLMTHVYATLGGYRTLVGNGAIDAEEASGQVAAFLLRGLTGT